jgi:4-carboxymuconolactone decarboxylase
MTYKRKRGEYGRHRQNPRAGAARRYRPDLVRLTDDVLFGDVWANPGLSPRDRSLITVAALVSLYRTDQLGSHLQRALANGLTKDQLVQAITHLAFYAGWPNAMTAITQLKKITEE